MSQSPGQPDPYEQTRFSPTSTSPPSGPPQGYSQPGGQQGGQPGGQSQGQYGQQPQYGQPQYGQPQGQQPQYGQQPSSAQQYGQQPQYSQAGQSPYQAGQNPYGGSPYGAGPYDAAATGPTTLSKAVKIIGGVIAALGLLTVIAAFLPWVTGIVEVNGLGDSDYGVKDGMITLVLGLVAAIFGVVSALIAKRSPLHLVAGIIALITGLLIVLTSAIDIADISDYSPLLEVGFGLWLTLIAGIGLVIAGIAGIVKRK
ncbi:hypothetical protein [Williamsia muralis]|uniref:Uncharacterized protein n=1 Tax=Williamsia marianensis TaxID=85044 RepID=A0ABU4EUY4_WILMA|nr:hypothetical protein [Williamsia muralis]MDV7135060.1 hypothetical protein [Williamsia muralis]